MKKVLFFIDTLNGGGAEKVLTDILLNIDKTKYEVTVMTYWDQGIYIEEIKKDNSIKYRTCFKTLKHSENPVVKLYNFINIKFRENVGKFFPKLFYKYIIKEKYDIEVAFIEGITTKIISYSTNKKSKKYCWVHIDLEKKNYVNNFYRNKDEQIKCYRKFNKILCVSDEVKQVFIKQMSISNNVEIQYNPVDENKIIKRSRENIQEFHNSKKFIILTVGRLEPQKGYDRLLEVHKMLINEGFEYELWILGEGNKRSEFEKFIDDNNLNYCTKILGFKKNPYKYMRKADLFVCSSRTEGFSTVISEALILGIPIISTDCTGTKELLNNGEFGLLTNNNKEGLYSGMKKMLIEKALYKDYKLKAEDRGKSFRLNQRIKEIEGILDEKL